ncbi:MAG TPA: hypothetical protein VEW94_14195 [Chloroflexia bacterium]|nr:hypothetical protein [Chloroflexia bacterium]
MSEVNEAQVREAAQQVLDRAVSDTEYLKALEENPSQVLQEAGIGVDANVTFSRKSSDGEVQGFCNNTSICIGIPIIGGIEWCRDFAV